MICGHDKTEIILEPSGYKLSRCLSCGLIFSKPETEKRVNPLNVYAGYYKSEKSSRFGSVIEVIVKVFRFARARKIASLNRKARRALDIGSGRGWILYFLKKYFNYEIAAGTQIAANAYKFSKEELKLEIYNQDFLELSFPEKFDVVSILHVLEHVENPEKYVERIYESLAPHGFLFIEVPNYNSWSRKITNCHWLALDLKYHLFFFTPESLIDLLEKYNFKIKKIKTFSLEYSIFTSIQSFVNCLTNSDSYFFNWLQKREYNFKIIGHALLFIVLFFPCLIINLGLYFSRAGEVITIIAQKND